MTDKELYIAAKEAYYNGEPIMTDHEFDMLEQKLGLENKGYVGTKHSPNYTVKHPFIMGSLSKVQVHADKNGNVDWGDIYNKIISYVGSADVIASPKYDGCSFEIHVIDGELNSISTRGDGEYGKDIMPHIRPIMDDKLLIPGQTYVIRGEVLVKKSIFEAKYKDKFANPRSFVAGTLNADFNDEIAEQCKDLDIVCYDFKMVTDEGWEDFDFSHLKHITKSEQVCNEGYSLGILNPKIVEFIYNNFDALRSNNESDLKEYGLTSGLDYCMDGIVLKPVVEKRVWDKTAVRPKDCVAVKFIPQAEPTKITDIVWELGKTGEYFPTVYYEPVMMDGKVCTKASGHNIDWLLRKGVCIGAEVIISLAGDIIPYIYKVTKPKYDGDLMKLPEKSEINNGHLMATGMTEEEIRIEKFRNSARTLNVPGLGDAQIDKLIEELKLELEGDEFFGKYAVPFPISIFGISPYAVARFIGGKMGMKIADAYEEVLKTMRFEDFIASLNFRFCGKKVSHEVAMKLLGRPYNFTSMAEEGYSWIDNFDSQNWKDFELVCDYLNMTVKDWNDREEAHTYEDSTSDRIPIIMTGEPNGYNTKGDFLKAHPEYRETSSWKEVKIVFTNSLDSNTGKMKKAREKNIEIQLY